RRIETKSVEMKLLDPVAAVGDKKFAHRTRIRSVEINRITPIVFVFTSQIIIGVDAEIIPVGSKMVVNNIENYSQTQRMRAIDKCAQIVRSPIQVGRGEEIDSVVSPSEIPWKIGDWHHLDHRNSDAC